MIKGLGYLKYLKLSLIGFGISCFMVLGGNYVNAGWIQHIGELQDSVYNDSFDLMVNGKGNLLTQYFGLGKRVFMVQDGVYFFWSPDGRPYGYVNYYNNGVGTSTQGYYETYGICDYIGLLSGNADSPQNCSIHSIDDGNNTSWKRILGSLSNGGHYYYHYGTCTAESNPYAGFTLCFSSQEFNKSLCFYSGLPQDIRGSVCSVGGMDGYYYWSLGGSHQGFNSNLTGSQGLSAHFDNLDSSYLSYSPGDGYSYGTGGSSIEGGSYTGNFNSTTGNVVNTSCTKSQALQWYRCNGYKTRMCYSSYGNTDDLYTGPGVAQGYDLTGVDIEDVRFNSAWYRRNGSTGSSMGYSEWFDYWRKTYNVYKQNPQHTNPFLGVPVSIFTLMGNINSYGNPYTNESIIEFCDLSLYTANYNNPYTGVAYSAVCSMTPIELVDCQTSNGLNPDDGLPGDGYTNGTVGPVGSSWDGITNRSGYHDKPGVGTSGVVATGNDLNTFDDGTTFLNNFFNKLSDKFQYTNNNGVARIPSYIIVFLCAVILFKFLRK